MGDLLTTEVLQPFLELLGWKCGHRAYTMPMQLKGSPNPSVSCLSCGKRMLYDWDRMELKRGQG